MQKYANKITEIWEIKDHIIHDQLQLKQSKEIVDKVINGLNDGTIRVAEKILDKWQVNEWVKKAILLHFKFTNSKIFNDGYSKYYDKIPPKFVNFNEDDFKLNNQRIVPSAIIRNGSYIGKNVVIMPSFVNIGAYIGDNAMIDAWATIGSCAQIGKNCHISGGAGIGGVLEPIQNSPVIIEDNCFIGARSEIVEGVIIEEGSVISMGVFLGASTKIIERDSGEIIYGKVPAYSVVVPGCLPSTIEGRPGLYCAVIIKKVDENTRKKTSINELLRES